jgi:phosphatidylinositol alpha-1,6-mannosyltransferase
LCCAINAALRKEDYMPVLLTNDFPPAVGGIQRYMHGLAHALEEIGCGVCAVAPGPGDDSEVPFRVERFSTDGRLGRFVEMDRALTRARRNCRDGATIASTWNPAGMVGTYRRRREGSVAIFAMGAEILRQDTSMRRKLMLSTFERADVVFSISRFTSSQLELAGVRSAPILVHGGVDSWARRSDPSERPTILSVGRLVRRKGFDRVIEALPALRRFHRDVIYEIVGDGPDRSYLVDVARRCGVADRVRFLGSVSDATLRAAYERAWCFALPVRREGYEVEGFGLVYLEAAVVGVPSIGGRGSGAEDAIAHGQTGLVVDGTSGREIRDALELLLRDRDFAFMLGDAARKRALREFTWRCVAQKVIAALNLPAEPYQQLEVSPHEQPRALAALA